MHALELLQIIDMSLFFLLELTMKKTFLLECRQDLFMYAHKHFPKK